MGPCCSTEHLVKSDLTARLCRLSLLHKSFVTPNPPQPTENSGDLDFSSSNSLLEAAHLYQLVKPLLHYLIPHCCIILSPLFWCKNKHPTLTRYYGDHVKVKTWHIFPAIPGLPPWLQTGAVAVSETDKEGI